MTSSTAALPHVPAGQRALAPGRLLRGRPADPRWARPALLGLLALTAVLYLYDLGRNGWANDFYAAAVQAGTKSWKAFLFGSFDSSNFITVDKPPASLWVMELSARVFGVNYWSLLVPQALEGVASVALLHAAVRRWSGPVAGLLAGLVMALTPVAVLMFRFDNPDSLLVLAMTAAAYAMVRAIEAGRTRWLVTAGVLLGLAFLAKMLQAFLVVPGFALAYLWAGPPRLGKRIWQLVLAGAGIVAGAGWWVVIVQLIPAADRPYVGGSTDDSVLQLALGYNGLGRLDGSETGSIGPGSAGSAGGGAAAGGITRAAGGAGHGLAAGAHPGGSAFGGATGLTRLFSSEFGGQASWLLPAALLCLLALLWVSRRAARTDRTRAAALLWGGWLLCTGLVFSYMNGIIHTYYTVALVPAIGALTGIGAVTLWRARSGWPGRLTAAAGLAVTAGWAYLLLDRTPGWLPWLRWAVLLAGLASACAVLAWPYLTSLTTTRRGRRGLAGIPLILGLVAGLAGPAAYAMATVNSTHTGSLPTAGPQEMSGGPGGAGAGFGAGRIGGPAGLGRTSAGGTGLPSGTAGSGGTAPGRTAAGRGTGFPGGTAASGGTGTSGGSGGQGSSGAGGGFPGGSGPSGSAAGPGSAGGRGAAGGSGAGGPGGGLSGDTQVSSALVRLLERGASGYTWVAATEGSQEAAPLELATGGDPVMAIGGFNGTDPAPTLAEFEALVARHEIHYYIGRDTESFGGGQGSSAIAAWVAAHFTSETVGGQTVYDLTQPRTT